MNISKEAVFKNTLEDFIMRFPKLNDNYKNLCEKPFQQMKEMLENFDKIQKSTELEVTLNNFYGSILGVVCAMNLNLGDGPQEKKKLNLTLEPILVNDAIGSKVSARMDNILHYNGPEKHSINYDTEIEINSLLDADKGWNIKKMADQTQENGRKVVVGFAGLTRSGKTYLLSKLIGSYNFNDILEHTRSLSFLYNKNDILFVDNTGIDHRLKDIKESKFARFIQQLKARDFFLQSYTIYCSKILILVFNDLSPNDLKLYNIYHMLIEKCQSRDQLPIVVHNLKDYYSLESVYSKISNFLEPGFNLQKKQYKNTSHYYYEQSLEDNKKIIHIIMAREGSDAGNYFNPLAISFLASVINSYHIKEEFNPIGSFLMFSKLNLKNYVDIIEKEHFGPLLKNSGNLNNNGDNLPIELDKDKIQMKKEISVTNFLLESFGGVIDKLKRANNVSDYVIMKEDKHLLVFVYIPSLQELSLKITPIQNQILSYTLKVEGKRNSNNLGGSNNSINSNNSASPEKLDSARYRHLMNYEDFQVIISIDTNAKYETDIKYMSKSYKQSILMIKIPKVDEKGLYFSSTIL